MRFFRNLLIRIKGISKIKNLENAKSDQIIFKPVFADQWDNLPQVMQLHYANRSFSNDITIMKGFLMVETSWYAKFLSPGFQFLGALVPHAASHVPVTVKARSEPTSARYIMDRQFHFKSIGIKRFYSEMQVIEGNEVVEFMRYGIGWRTFFSWQKDRVILSHAGYVWRIFGILIPLPVSWLIGVASAIEIPVSETEFQMSMKIEHPFFGKIYSYHGSFKVEV